MFKGLWKKTRWYEVMFLVLKTIVSWTKTYWVVFSETTGFYGYNYDWEWFIKFTPPIKMVMTGGWCKWHCFTHTTVSICFLKLLVFMCASFSLFSLVFYVCFLDINFSGFSCCWILVDGRADKTDGNHFSWTGIWSWM